jgi:hypothetical protein
MIAVLTLASFAAPVRAHPMSVFRNIGTELSRKTGAALVSGDPPRL